MDKAIRDINRRLEKEQDAAQRQILQRELEQLQQAKIALAARGNKVLAAADFFDEVSDIADVEIDRGVNKFILLQVAYPEDRVCKYYVRAKTYAKYHYMAADPLIEQLMAKGVSDSCISVLGGGRIEYDGRLVFCYGYSNQFGQAPMDKVVEVIKNCSAFSQCEVTYSLDGY